MTDTVPTIPPLEFSDVGAANAEISFYDERTRGRFASVTLSSEAHGWGEFLSFEDVAALHAWTGELIRDHVLNR